jgi:hypothetical protein
LRNKMLALCFIYAVPNYMPETIQPTIAHIWGIDFEMNINYNYKAYGKTKKLIIWRCRLVWSRAHDWKSCRRQKRLESSNLSISAKTKGFRDFSENLFFSLKKCIITEMICFKGCDIFLVELDELNNLCRLF